MPDQPFAADRPSQPEPLRVVTVEEHFQHRAAIARVLELSPPAGSAEIDPPGSSDDFASFITAFEPDPDSAERLGGRRLEHMDAAGVDVQVVSHGANSPSALDHPDAVELCRRVNDDLAAQIAEHPTRFRGFATIPLHDPRAAADEMVRCVEELGFVGTLVMGSCGGAFLDHERFEPVLAAAERVDLPIYVHPGPPGPAVQRAYYAGAWPASVRWIFAQPAFGWHAEAGIHVVRMILSGALDRHPGLKLLSGHWGEFMAGWLERLDETMSWTPLRLERTVSRTYRDQVWVTPSGLYSHSQLAFFLAEMGPERIIHSEDFPYVVRDHVRGFLQEADLTDHDRRLIAHGNAEALLRI